MARAIADLRGSEIAANRLLLDGEKLKRKDQELDLARAKFQRETCELFLTWNADERAAEIAAGSQSNEDKINALGQLMFGEHFTALKSQA
jgi:hypothetical protein